MNSRCFTLLLSLALLASVSANPARAQFKKRFAPEASVAPPESFLYGSASTLDTGGSYIKGGTSFQAPFQVGVGAFGNRRFMPLKAKTASAAISGKTKQVLYKAFLRMNCLEFNELGANYYTAERNYAPVRSERRLSLPGFRGGLVELFSNGKKLIAIDPRTSDTWVASYIAADGSGMSWRKLTHRKN